MSANESQESASVERREEYEKSPSDFTKHWLECIEAASTEEKDWREAGEKTVERYSTTKAKTFNILYANTQTTVPALYNSEPVPDIRRRFSENDPVGKAAAMVIERGLSIQCELYDFDGAMQAAVKDRQLPGRGVTRVRLVTGAEGSKHLECEPVVWSEFRRGPAKMWRDVPWVAFRHKMSREELEELSPEHGGKVQLDAVLVEAPKGKEKADISDKMKRATVWEVWDRLKRQVYFFAESFKDGPLTVIPDPYELRDFFPVPRPLYAIGLTDSLVPVCEFTIWKPLADEVDTLTARISSIVKVMKWRGLYHGAFANIIKTLDNLDDGQLAAAEDSARAMSEGGIDKAIWMMPVADAAALVEKLYEARQAAQQQVYELTGVADILRGSTQASETATAQQIKAQWGSLRLQEAQREVQRYARDLYRIMADLMSSQFDGPELSAMTGIQLQPEVMALLQGQDLNREFVIEVETDSTIRADLTRSQQNISTFIQGFGQFVQSVGPAVQMGAMPGPIAVKLLQSFSRPFKLGREAEAVMDEWAKMLEQQAAQPPAPPPPDPKVELEKARLDADVQERQARLQMDVQEKTARFQMDKENADREFGLKQAEHGMKREQMAQQAQSEQQRMAVDAFQKDADRQHQVGMTQQQFAREDMQKAQEAEAENEAPEAEDQATMKALVEGLSAQGEAIAKGLAQQGQSFAQGLDTLAKAMMSEQEIVRGEDGRVAGARRRPPQTRMN
jgi:hypothetical protein